MEIVYDFKQSIWGIAIDAEDNIFVANSENYSIDKVSLDNGKVSITQSAKTTSFRLGLGINSKNEIYFAAFGEIMKMTKEGIISSIAGKGKLGFADGIGKDAELEMCGMCFDENDIAYFCDWDNYSGIRKLTPEGKVTTVCGGGSGFSDGKGKEAKFYYPIGIVYNYSTKLFYITDHSNKSIRTMTVDGNVNTLCKYSDYLQAIAIDGEGKLYVSTVKDSITGKGELITVDTKGELKKMNISVKNCGGIAINSKGDLFFTSDNKLCVIRNCTKYPPRPILAPTTNVNTKELQHENQELRNLQIKSKEMETQLAEKESEIQHLREQLADMNSQAHNLKIRLGGREVQIKKLSNEKEELVKENNEQKEEIEKLKEQIRPKKSNNETKGWLSPFILANKNINL